MKVLTSSYPWDKDTEVVDVVFQGIIVPVKGKDGKRLSKSALRNYALNDIIDTLAVYMKEKDYE